MKEPRSFRPTEGMLEDIDQVVRANPAKYTGRSHFVRCAIVRLLRSEGGRE